MPRGRAPRYETQREQILARAAELFAQHGYTATTMNQVAQACGVSKPSLYHYVRDKYQLLVEIAEQHVQRLTAVVGRIEALGLEPSQRLRLLIDSFMVVYADAQADHHVLTEDVKFLELADRERILRGQRLVVEAFAGAIAQGHPHLHAAQLHKPLATLLFGMLNWMHTWVQPGGRLRHADLAPIVIDLFLGGLCAVRGPAGAADARLRAPGGCAPIGPGSKDRADPTPHDDSRTIGLETKQ